MIIMAMIRKVKIKNIKTGRMNTRYVVGNKNRKFAPKFYTKTAAKKFAKRHGQKSDNNRNYQRKRQGGIG